ncbi:MAG: hypothetical protein Ct9H300mP8_07640 [Gammaproteobacteria bacterium]|nr:MAG: hypothetical protein Ct9H300mP8_07640 [Gammaproteobacteria bacterium]
MELRAAIEGFSRTFENDPSVDHHGLAVCATRVTEWVKRWKANGWKKTSRGSVKNKDLWVELDEGERVPRRAMVLGQRS